MVTSADALEVTLTLLSLALSAFASLVEPMDRIDELLPKRINVFFFLPLRTLNVVLKTDGCLDILG